MPFHALRSLLSSFAFLTVLVALAQQAEVARFDVDQGLPQSMVNHVLQDADGFIWLGTGNGLARFDGQRFVVYKHEANDAHSLSHNSIWGLAQRDPRSLWVSSRGGLDVLDLRTGRFERVATGDDEHDGCWMPLRSTPGDALFYSPLLNSLLRIREGRFVRTVQAHIDSYVLRLSGDGNTLHRHVRPDSLVSIALSSGSEQVWHIPVRSGERVCDMLLMGERWLVLTETGGWIWNGRSERSDVPGELHALLHAAPGRKLVERAPDGRLWFAISGVGVVVVDDDFNVRAQYPLLPKEQRPLNLTCLTFDRQGNTWVGTDGKGVFRIAPQRIHFGRCMPGQGAAWEPRSWFVRGFAQWDSTHVLVSFFEGGLALFDERTHRLAPLQLAGSAVDLVPLNDKQGRIWYTDGNTARALDPASGRLVYDHQFACKPVVGRMLGGGTTVGSMCEPFKEVLDAPGVPQLTALGVRSLEHQLDSLHTIPHHYFMDRSRRIWLSSELMPFSVWSSQGRVLLQPQATSALGDQVRLTDMAEDDLAIWSATNEGLWKWRRTDLALLDHFTVQDGLPDQYLLAILPAGDGSLWLSSYNGLGHFDPLRKSIVNYGVVDGVQSKEFNGRAAFRSRSGRLYFGGVNGFNHFMPDEVRDDPDRPLVRITRLWTNNGDLELPQHNDEFPLELPYPRNELHLEVTILEFSASELNTYKWRLPGYHDEWTRAKASTSIELNNVPGGEFTLEVIGVNGDGVESEVYQLLRIAVVRPFWASSWFIALVAAVIVALVAWLWTRSYRRRMLRKLEDAEREMKDLRMRTRLAKDIHDDVGSGLARMAALSRSPKRNIDTDARFEKLSDLSGELLENLRDVVWINDPQQGTLDALLLRVREYANDLFEDTDATITCEFPDPLPPHTLDGAFRRNLFLIAKEALHNARKYSHARSITLRWAQDDNDFTFEIMDDGIGITSDTPQGGGYGSENMHQRALEIGASYQRTSGPGGTMVSVDGRTSHP